LDLRRVRTFVAVADLGTVSKAAQHLRVAQPALSRQISSLEQEVGFKLFDRVGRGLMLTGEGQQLLSDCRALLSHASAVDERAKLLRSGDRGVLKVAASPQYIEGAICDFLHHYGRAYPNVHVKLTEALAGHDVLGLLESGDIHLGQCLLRAVQPHEHRFANLPLDSVGLIAGYRPTFALTKSGIVDIVKLASHPLLVLGTETIFRQTFDSACRLAGIEPNIALESRTPHTLLAMAESGHGIAIVPSVLRISRYKLRVAAVSYQGKALREPLAILWDRRRPLPHYATAFCEMLPTYLKDRKPMRSKLSSAGYR
jgi:DNA-binding transcriptional LysR family regulator